ncbi:hypothetical protein F4821DRAFT_264977 [Hypoxylon rubiginosum]|uniref:Uncharacterized protein n=1 Tax=Hypoxylon rubiginosum TaxID=110542 RepID=A0ACC0CLW6_9PEZI|nr:hypothetical protein F4821DRAFT_264977 [Hypoxylon rubiginosum]
MPNAIENGGLSVVQQQVSYKRLRNHKDILSNPLPVVQYYKSVSAQEFERTIGDGHVDLDMTLYREDVMESLAASQSWQSMWKLMLYVFGCSPWDLESWGLRLSLREKEKVAKLLGRLLPHPVWECRVDVLRYLLRKTILYRCKSNVEPLGPLAPGIANVLLNPNRLGRVDRANTALEMWHESTPRTNHNIDQLLTEISNKAAELSLRPQSTNLLILEPADVMMVSDALDTLYVFTVDQYWDSFVRHHLNWPNDMAPHDAETTLRWDKASLSEKVERMNLGEPDIPLKEREHNEELAYWKSSDCDYGAAKLVNWGNEVDGFYFLDIDD